MPDTEQERSLDARFFDAYKNIKNPPMNGFNPHFKSQFAELKDVLDVVNKACDDVGIGYIQLIERDGSEQVLKSIVFDGSTTKDLSTMKLIESPDIQKFGSNITYTRRYQALTDWGIVGDKDDDGNGGSVIHEKRVERNQDKQQNKELQDAKQRLWNAVKAYAERHGLNPVDVAKGVESRPEYELSAVYLDMVAQEFESDLQ